MPSFHVFLRVLLCISLVFYGSGANAAATRMQMGYATAAPAIVSSTDPVSSAMAVASCHEASATGLPPAGQTVAHHHGAGGGHASAPASPDCCEATSCDCSCAQQVQVATMSPILRGPVAARSTAVRPMTTGYASPALPHLMRPPIG